MRKLIEKHQESLIVCDNHACDFKVPYTDEEAKFVILYINKPCPKCSTNLLTYQDYIQHQRIVRTVDWINRWFSWITIFYSKESLDNRHVTSVHVHDGIKIKHES